MPKKADIGSKRLISLDPQGWIRWILQNPQVIFQEMISSQFEWVSREGDVLIRATDPVEGEFLVANELQLRYTNVIARRMRAYTGLAEEKYNLPVYPVLVIILPAPKTEIVTCYRSNFKGIQAQQDYRVIQLSEVDAQRVFDQPLPTLLPFVPIMQGGNDEAMIREALRLLQRDPKLSELETLLAFFATFVMESQLVTEIMRWDMTVLRESPWYQEIDQRGEQRGIQIGKQEGKQSAIPVLAEFGLSAAEIARRLDLPLDLVQATLGSVPNP